ncbi:MAG: hypothetical protein JJE22_06080 [Bacteroidia bacterium]|nr:hypothetical protein [Bacteroidia bacterium]
MDNSFFAYLEQLELLAFFSGYPLLYAVVIFIAGKDRLKNNFKNKLASFLPSSYALVGTLFLGLQLKKLYPDYNIGHLLTNTQLPFLTIWGVLSVLFWIPFLNKKGIYSLIHSLVFFFLLMRSLFLHPSVQSSINDEARNNMKIYTVSILLNLAALLFVSFISYLIDYFKNQKKSTPV